MHKLFTLRMMYLRYTFLYPQVPRINIVDNRITSGNVINKAENTIYIDLKKRGRFKKDITNIIPEFNTEDYSFINYHYVRCNETQESLLSLSPSNRKSKDIELGKIDRNNDVSYQIKIGESPVKVFSSKDNLPTSIKQDIDLLERVEDYLKRKTPKYFKLQAE